MSDFLDELLTDGGVITKPVTFKGKTGDVHFRRLSGAQRSQLLRGQKVTAVAGQSSVIEIDLEKDGESKALLVHFCVVTADGKPRFKRPQDAAAVDAELLEELAKVANEVNRADLRKPAEGEEGEDAGKA